MSKEMSWDKLIQHPQQTILEKKLRREYKQLARTAMKLEDSTEHTLEQKLAFLDKMLERQKQIVKEVEQCTGIAIYCPTFAETIEENKRIQDQGKKEGTLEEGKSKI